MNFAFETHKETKRPSEDKSSVGRWILSPAILAMLSGFLAAAGIGRCLTANNDIQFVIGLGMFGAGSAALITIMVKSWSFDKTGEIRTHKQIPIIVPDDSKQKPVTGNAAVPLADRYIALKTEHNGKKYHWSATQLNLAKSRFDQENYRVSRDYLNIPTRLYSSVESIMRGLDYWRIDPSDERYFEWTETGEDWVNSHLRPTG